MKIKNTILISFSIILGLAVFLSCSETENPVTDAQKLAALKNVTVSVNGVEYNFDFPQDSIGAQTLSELLNIDSSKYANPANYQIDIAVITTIDNTAENARDAKFDGMYIDLVFDTISSNPVRTETGPFEVAAGSTKEVSATGSINLETHKLPGKYILQQTVDGAEITTTLSPILVYKIGTLEGELPLPSVTLNIPTRASDETKAFFKELLESEMLE